MEEKLSTRIQMYRLFFLLFFIIFNINLLFRLSSLNNDIDSKDLEINRLKKKNQDFENDNNLLSIEKENLK